MRNAHCPFQRTVPIAPTSSAIEATTDGTRRQAKDRPLLVFSCPCKCSSEVFPWQIDRGPPLLHIFIDLLLYWSCSPPSEPPFLQHGIWLLRCRSSANDAQLKNLWLQLERCYAVAAESAFSRFDKLLGATNIQTVVASGGRILMTNEPLGGPNLQGRRKYRGGYFIHLDNPVCMFERLN